MTKKTVSKTKRSSLAPRTAKRIGPERMDSALQAAAVIMKALLETPIAATIQAAPEQIAAPITPLRIGVLQDSRLPAVEYGA